VVTRRRGRRPGGSRDEWSTSCWSGTAQGARFVLKFGRPARAVGRRWPALPRAGRSNHLKGSPARPGPAVCVAVPPAGSGQLIQRSDDGGEDVGSRSATNSGTRAPPARTRWYDGTPHPWEFARVWHLEPSLKRSGTTVYGRGGRRGLVSASTDGREGVAGTSPGCAGPRLRGPSWQPGGGRDVPAHDHPGSGSARADFRGHLGGGRVSFSDDEGPDVAGPVTPRSEVPRASPTRTPRSATACTTSRCPGRAPACCTLQKHWDVMAQRPIPAEVVAGRSGRQPLGRPTSVSRSTFTRHEAGHHLRGSDQRADSQHFPPEGKACGVLPQARTGGNEVEPLTKGPCPAGS